jgi:3-phosphoshikimate 1-carboxyvinyltransferase
MTGSLSTSPDRPPRRIPSGGRIAGSLPVPSSKSVTHRFLNLVLLSRAGDSTSPTLPTTPTIVERPLYAEDTRLFLAALGRAGFAVEASPEAVRLTPGPRPPAGEEVEIFCGNAGTMLRFLVATLAVVPGAWRLDGTPRLRERPVGPLVTALRRLGAKIEYLSREGCVPLRIAGGTLGGGVTSIDAGESSQYLSALLMAGLAAPAEVVVEVGALTSHPYIEVTLAAAAAFGGRIERLGEHAFRVLPSPLAAGRVRVEGDWSAACYPAAAAALTGGDVHLSGVFADSRQGDRRFLDLLAAMGAEIGWEGDLLTVRGPREGPSGLRGIDADLSGVPDQVPTLAAVAPFARGTTRITNVPHLRIKESDRLGAMASELGRAGAAVEEGADSLTIHGVWHDRTPPAEPVRIDSHDDHRIAMSMALVGLRRPGIEIASPEVVGKSYPEFWTDLESLLRESLGQEGGFR